MTMRAVRLHGIGDLRIEDVPRAPAPGAGEISVAVSAAGICGSDIHNYLTGQWISNLPVTPGHEFAGRITAVGGGVAGLSEGDLVSAISRVSCGVCGPCRRGLPNACDNLGFVGEVCDGGFAEEVTLSAAQVVRVPGEIDARVAAMIEPCAVALRALRQSHAAAGGALLIVGGGTIGGLVAVLANHLGVGPIGLVEKNPDRVARLGARVPLTHLSLDGLATFGADATVEATGSAQVLDRVLHTVPAGGTIALVGLFHGAPETALNAVVERELTLRGSSAFVGEMTEMIDILPSIAPDLLALAGDPIEIDAVPAAYQTLIDQRAPVLKVLMSPNPSAAIRG